MSRKEDRETCRREGSEWGSVSDRAGATGCTVWVEVMPGVAGRGLRWPPHLGHGIRGHLPWTGSPVANGRCAAPAGVRVSPECTGTGACAWDEGPSPTATRTGSAWCSLSSRPLLAHMLPCPKPRRSPLKATRIVAGVGRGPQGACILHVLVTELTRVTARSACP